MFGTIVINPDELKIKDYRKYRSYLLRCMPGFERASRPDLPPDSTYDMTFLALLLTGLYEKRGESGKNTLSLSSDAEAGDQEKCLYPVCGSI